MATAPTPTSQSGRRAGASRFLIGCLAAGLVMLTLVLLPLLHLSLQDSPR